ncbi:MAG TPA: phosphoethanolamine--lipid A transferase [Gammaproteobacteria bacterium]|nr:phosphoethanolamine--lipid A transferase [Xanthomonadales bacterium]MCB1594563.1 phosphoethanolamine--lipid A transferase [Xanthomonadales bacterium]HOP21707.1 phosphoethanolamine--lipid A transferase [Gammaproteobacteria bacterium]HPI95586.1 phosphoethanolamine--lipid A transferase [Gammaproteobacteria bacterium]HPQ86831.1 phosphoethanolamine--lipid A transferase [Gammaproteobacteria bacterium]
MKLSQFKIWQLNLLASFLFVILYNIAFWKEIYQIIKPETASDYFLFAAIFVFLVAVINLILSLFTWQKSYKLFYIIIFLIASASFYFIYQYNIVIDKEMVRNVMETSSSEGKDLISSGLIFVLFLLGILPSYLLYKLKSTRDTYRNFLFTKIKSMGISIAVILLVIYLNYASFASIARNNRNLSHVILPTNFIFALVSFAGEQFKSATIPYNPIAEGANQDESLNDKKQVYLLIIGETARADRFSLNGYEKETNPFLSKRHDIINFTNTSSCGTNTATSLPCIFSHLDRTNYSHKIAKNTDSLLDFFKNAGFDIQWRDNNTGCKGICKPDDFLDLTMDDGNSLCNEEECYDEILFKDLYEKITQNPNNQVYVLHPKGSHGPAYYLRYPKRFEIFQPTCQDIQLQKCQKQEIDNSYDNTILYADYIIDSAIKLLEKLPKDTLTTMVYLSDHGESLGENNLYLHGTPYMFAPSEQTKVPFIIWLSDSLQESTSLDFQCLLSNKDIHLSHDNFFHSMLGMAQINTKYYDQSRDIFYQCQPK